MDEGDVKLSGRLGRYIGSAWRYLRGTSNTASDTSAAERGAAGAADAARQAARNVGTNAAMDEAGANLTGRNLAGQELKDYTSFKKDLPKNHPLRKHLEGMEKVNGQRAARDYAANHMAETKIGETAAAANTTKVAASNGGTTFLGGLVRGGLALGGAGLTAVAGAAFEVPQRILAVWSDAGEKATYGDALLPSFYAKLRGIPLKEQMFSESFQNTTQDLRTKHTGEGRVLKPFGSPQQTGAPEVNRQPSAPPANNAPSSGEDGDVAKSLEKLLDAIKPDAKKNNNPPAKKPHKKEGNIATLKTLASTEDSTSSVNPVQNGNRQNATFKGGEPLLG
jgi:hypothetical protein